MNLIMEYAEKFLAKNKLVLQKEEKVSILRREKSTVDYVIHSIRKRLLCYNQH